MSRRIVHIVGLLDPAYGGPSINVLELAAAQHARGDDVEVISTDRSFAGGGRYVAPVDQWEFPIRIFGVGRPASYNMSLGMAQHLRHREHDADVVHAHSVYSFPTLAAALYARSRRTALVVEPHGALTRYHRAEKRRKKGVHERVIDRPLLRAAGVVRCASIEEQSDLAFFEPAAFSMVVPHGVNPPAFAWSTHPARRTVPPTVVFLGRLTKKKRLDLTIEAFAIAKACVPTARLRIVGTGEAAVREECVRLVRKHGLETSVDIVGARFGSSKWDELADATAFVLLSDDESFGIAPLEALSVGVPVIVSGHVASMTALAGSGHVRIVAQDAASAGAALVDILADRSLAQSAQGFAETIREGWSWRRVADEVDALYEAAASRLAVPARR